MPYPSIDLLSAAAADLAGCHPLTVISVPALLRAAHENDSEPTNLQPFGSKQEQVVLGSFWVVAGSKPYLAVWSNPPVLVNRDYSGSTLQRQRTQDILGRSIFNDDYDTTTRRRRQFSLKENAGATLAASSQRHVNIVSLAVWLARDVSTSTLDELVAWFREMYPFADTDLSLFYEDKIPDALASVADKYSASPVDNEAITERLLPAAKSQDATVDSAPIAESIAEDLLWTREVCQYPLTDADVAGITARILEDVAAQHVYLPDAETLVTRCVTALLVGHLVLQGPPGTGKTTLARALARGFRSQLVESTATSEWSPFHVVGGFRPSRDGALAPSYGKVVEAALMCARMVRASANLEAGEPAEIVGGMESAVETTDEQAAWLLIDELNRADIDKAIGSLYTLLSSCDPAHLRETPVDLWFESDPGRRNLWVPARFRLLATMNDLDTSFVNRLSQGLVRRFQFVTVGVPLERATTNTPVTDELEAAFAGAYEWLDHTYGAAEAIADRMELRGRMAPQLERLQRLIDTFRAPGAAGGWPVGTAQVVDTLKVLLLRALDSAVSLDASLSSAVADRLVPQMADIYDEQVEVFVAAFQDLGMQEAAEALRHLVNPHASAPGQ